MPTKRAAAKPAKPKKVEKPKLTAKKPAAKPVAAKAPVKARARQSSRRARSLFRRRRPRLAAETRAGRQRHSGGAGDPQGAAIRTHRRDRDGRVVHRSAASPPARAPPTDADGDDDAGSLLAGPRNVQPYIAKRGEQYMNKEQLEHFRNILNGWKRDLMEEVDRTVSHMKDEAANFPDPNDRATQEEEFSLELRTRDRERKLIRKIDEALKRVEDGSYGYCLETGEEIGVKRLEARPVATLTIEAQERRERRERQYGDRDDRYR